MAIKDSIDSGLRGCTRAWLMLELRTGLAKLGIASEVDLSDGMQAKLLVPRTARVRASDALTKMIQSLRESDRLGCEFTGLLVCTPSYARMLDRKLAAEVARGEHVP